MASIASLFGPSAEEIVYSQRLQERTRQQQQLQEALAAQQTLAGRNYYQAGYNIAKGLGGLFGVSPAIEQDPRIAKALEMRQIFGDFSAQDLNDPTKLEELAGKLVDKGYIDQGFQLFDRSMDIASKIAAAKPDIKNVDIYVDNEGNKFHGGTIDGRIVAVDQETGDYYPAPQGSSKYVEPKRGTAKTPGANELGYAEQSLDTIGEDIMDTGWFDFTGINKGSEEYVNLTRRIAAEAQRLIDANEADDIMTASDMATLKILGREQQVQTSQTFSKETGLSRTPKENETVMIAPDGRMVIVDPTDTDAQGNPRIKETGSIAISPEIASKYRASALAGPASQSQSTQGYVIP